MTCEDELQLGYPGLRASAPDMGVSGYDEQEFVKLVYIIIYKQNFRGNFPYHGTFLVAHTDNRLIE
jgi:hypothetical protein